MTRRFFRTTAINRCPLSAAGWVLMLTLGGCSEETDHALGEPPVPLVAPSPRTPDGVFEDEGLLELARLGIRQDVAALVLRLGDSDSRVRARAAFTLASMGGEEERAALLPLLRDSVAQVRRDAAFALGRLGVPDGGAQLLDALAVEFHSEVRERLLEALGLQGGESVVEPLLAMTSEGRWRAGSGEGEALYLALARIALRGAEDPSEALLSFLLEGLSTPSREVREAAATYFALDPDPRRWEVILPQVREILAHYHRNEPAAMHLLQGLGRRRDPEEVDLISKWLREGEDFRIRVNAARALGTARVIERPGVREALWEAVERDPADPVAAEAAASLLVGLRVPAWVYARAESALQDPGLSAPRLFPFLPALATARDWQPVLSWTRTQVVEDPSVAAFGIRALGLVSDIPVTEFLFQLADHHDPAVRAAALEVLEGRWNLVLGPGGELERYFHLFRRELEGRDLPGAVHGVRALGHPGFRHLGSVDLLLEALGDLSAWFEEVDDSRPRDPQGALARAVLLSEVRAVLARAGELLPPQPAALDPDPETGLLDLASLGPEPVLELETMKGTLLIRLVPEEAPLTVWTVLRVVEGGGWSGVPFHRVEPNFVAQGGDGAAWDGSGFTSGPGALEQTSISFRRGVVGLASIGMNWEGLQFFITHSHQPQLDTEHTAFGWVVEGGEVLNRIRTGDRILRAGIQPVR